MSKKQRQNDVSHSNRSKERKFGDNVKPMSPATYRHYQRSVDVLLHMARLWTKSPYKFMSKKRK